MMSDPPTIMSDFANFAFWDEYSRIISKEDK